MKRIHIVSTSARSGTTLLAECMRECFEIDGYVPHEAPLSARLPGSEIFLTKWPSDVVIVEPRLRIDRNLFVICLIRDPRDVIVSRHGNDPNRYWVTLNSWKRSVPHLRRLMHHKRFLTVRYENLVREPDAIQDLIGSHMPFLRTKKAFSSYHEVAQPSKKSLAALGSVRPITTDTIGHWRNHLPRVAGQLQIHGPITDDLIEFGYEQDDSWLAQLDGIEPDLSPSRWPDNPPRQLPFKRWYRRYSEPIRVALSWLSPRPSI